MAPDNGFFFLLFFIQRDKIAVERQQFRVTKGREKEGPDNLSGRRAGERTECVRVRELIVAPARRERDSEGPDDFVSFLCLCVGV